MSGLRCASDDVMSVSTPAVMTGVATICAPPPLARKSD